MSLSFASSRVLVPDRVVTRAAQGVTILLNADTGGYFMLDDTGARAWEALTSSASIQEAYERLLSAYDVAPDVLRRDLEDLLQSLEAQGLAEVCRA
jgi:hypothetical protein